jgi:serine/threonine-protein kinase
MVERQLATFIGPLARIIVSKAASRTTDPEELYELVAASLEREADRKAFIARKVGLSTSKVKGQSSRESSPIGSAAMPANAASGSELTPAAIDRAARMLARHVGPISRVLAKRAAQRADSVRAFYLLLAEHVESKTERARFLRDAGFIDS